MLKRQHAEALRVALASRHGQVESISFDGKTASLADVLDELRSFGLMQQYKLVFVDDADKFVSSHRAALERYAQALVDQATLVLRCDRWNKGKLDRLIEQFGCLISCEKMTASAAKAWLIQRAQEVHQIKLSAPIASRLVERMGSDLMTLDNELGKLALFATPDGMIDPKLLSALTGKTSDEKAWAVQEAILHCLATSTRSGRQVATTRQVFSSSRSHTPRAGAGVTAVGQAIEKIHELVDLSGEAEVFVAYCIADLLRKLHLGTVLQEQGASTQQIGRRLRLWGRSQTLFYDVIRQMDSEKSAEVVDTIINRDVKAKSGVGQAVRHLECFCTSLL